MLEFLKRQNIAFYLSIVACVLTIVGIITVCVSSSVQVYAMANLGLILFCTIAAIVLMAAGIFLADKFGAQHYIVAIVNLVAMVLLMVAFANVIMERAVLASAQFSYDAVNTVGWGVLYNSIAGLVMFLLSAILLVVGAFFKDKNRA